MKKFLFGLIATVLFSISLHSQDYVTYIRTIENPKIENNEFNFDFKSFDFKNSLIGGKILIGKQIVDLEMNISKGINISEIKEISEKSVTFLSNGEYLTFDIISQNEEFTTIRFTTKDITKDFIVDSKINFEKFSDIWNENQSNLSKVYACPPCIVIVVGIVVGGAYCAFKMYTASNSCLASYQACVKEHGSCSYQFESSGCGGTCQVNPH
jgi:hypothetical protein